MLGTALYKARLVPRALPALGIIGAPILITWVIGTILGLTGPGTPFHVIAILPFFVWELALGLWLTFKGFNENSPRSRSPNGQLELRSSRRVRRRRDSQPRQVSRDRGAYAGGAARAAPLLRLFWALHRSIYRASDAASAPPRHCYPIPNDRGRWLRR